MREKPAFIPESIDACEALLELLGAALLENGMKDPSYEHEFLRVSVPAPAEGGAARSLLRLERDCRCFEVIVREIPGDRGEAFHAHISDLNTAAEEEKA